MNSPWAFGWTQLLTLMGFAVTIGIALSSFRTLDRWRKEKIEEKKLDIALEALSIAYEAKMVFDDIQRQFIGEYEWSDMPTEGMDKKEKEWRQSLYAIINRLARHVTFFERALGLQPKFMAVFGPQTNAVFTKLFLARHNIQIAIETLMPLSDPMPGEEELVAQMRADIWNHTGPKVKDPGRTPKLVAEFQSEIERICSPLVNRTLRD